MSYPRVEFRGCLVEARVAAQDCESIGAVESGALDERFIGGVFYCVRGWLWVCRSGGSKRFAKEGAGWVGVALGASSRAVDAGI